MELTQEMKAYIDSCRGELIALIRTLCAIPAPSHHEHKRAIFCRDWFVQNGAPQAYIDAALNVVCPWNAAPDNDLTVIMAHTDTVFPDLEPMPLTEADGRMYCPGVTDDTANLAVLMICARYVIQNCAPGQEGMLFVANSCEEGLGNLKGSRQLFADYGSRIRRFITIDGTNLNAVVNQAVGSHRYRVSVRTEGGHSFGSFGNKNAIHCLSAIISTLYTVTVPVEGNSRTTYNVGMISGGTSINTIAQYAEMLYEYRSDSLACLRQMEAGFHRIIETYRRSGIDVTVEKIGDRPCSGDVSPEAQQALIGMADACIRRTTGEGAVLSSGSTDANIALAAGTPAICISACNGGKCHTREEWLDIGSLDAGCALVMDLLTECIQ